MSNVIVLIPLYKEQLTPSEKFAIAHSLNVLRERAIMFIGPQSLDIASITKDFGDYRYQVFDDACFASVAGYSRMLLSPDFYENLSNYEFALILQTDAIVLRDELEGWCAQPFDYIGAPWPDGFELFVNMGPFAGANGKKVKVHVGNGGLSLRRLRKCQLLLLEFPEVVETFHRTGSSEDLFFSVMGALSIDFLIPNEVTASRFAMELKPSFYHSVNGGFVPMGGHAWEKYEPEFWRKHIVKTPVNSDD